MPQEGLDQCVGEFVQVMAGGLQPFDVRHLDAVDPLHGDDITPGALPIDLGNPEPGIVLGVLRKFGKSGGLEPQIHLDLGGLLQRACHLYGA